MQDRRSPSLGLHEKSERDRAFQRAREAFETGMSMREDEVLFAHAAGYLEAIRDISIDHDQPDLARAVEDMISALRGTPGVRQIEESMEREEGEERRLTRERGLRRRIAP